MTSIEITILKINQKLISAFALLDTWLDRADLFQKTNDDESVLGQLEHVLFENQIMLRDIQRAVAHANALHEQGAFKPGRYTFLFDKSLLTGSAQRKVTVVSEDLQSSPETLRLLLRDQLYRCMLFLDQLSAGQGRLVQVTLPLDAPTTLDPYQALYFVAANIQQRMNAVEAAYSRMDACSTI